MPPPMSDASASRSDPPPLEVSPEEVASLLASDPDGVQLIDCRRADEWAICRLPGAILAPVEELGEHLDKVDSSRRVVVYCHLGGRSLMAARALRQHGAPEAQSMAGGIERWAVEIDPETPRY